MAKKQNWREWKKKRMQMQADGPAPSSSDKGTVVKVDLSGDEKKGKKGKQAEK